jgi:membrane-bound serine protease (ClpP class)
VPLRSWLVFAGLTTAALRAGLTRPALIAAAFCLVVATVTGQERNAERPGSPQSPGEGGPLVITAEYDGIIHPIAVEYLTEVIDQADTSGASLVVVVLRTPGGLLDSTRAIVSRMIRSRAPVVVFVGPAGARAASAGFVLTLAADVAVMAPGTHIGAAHPVSGTGEPADATTSEKAAADAAAYARTLAEARRRNVTLAGLAVTESRAFTDTEAASASPPLIDFIAPSVDDVLRRLDGQSITRFDGRSVTSVTTAGAQIRSVTMTRRQRFLGAIAHPQIAYLLLTLGMLGFVVELWNPGATLPAVVGGLSLLLAFFAFQILPVNTVGVLLIVFGIALLVLEVKVPSFGALGVGGTISLFMGSVMVTRDVPGIRVNVGVILPVVISVAVIALLLGRLAVAAQRQPTATGTEGLIGRDGRARTALEPGAAGQIDIHGEIWRAVSDTAVAAGQRVRVLALKGLTLEVTPVDTPPSVHHTGVAP